MDKLTNLCYSLVTLNKTNNMEKESQPTAEKYQILDNPYERMNYVHLTDKLIAELDGSEGKPYDAVIFLDSSARPVSWLMRELWEYCAAKDENGNTPPMPKNLFLDVDGRRQVGNIEHLRELYKDKDGNDLMSGKRVLVVDEIAVSGDTLYKAETALIEAFPDTTFKTYAWMDERHKLMPDNNPRWYDRGNDRYRAVLGGHGWLAVPNPDRKGANVLRHEMSMLAADVMSGRLPFWAADFSRPEAEERLMSLTGMDGREFRLLREWMREHYAPDAMTVRVITDDTGPLSDEDVMKYMRRSRRHLTILGGNALRFATQQGYIVGSEDV